MDRDKDLSDADIRREATGLAAKGDYETAARLLTDLVERQRRELPAPHPSVGRTLAELALVRFTQRNIREAKLLAQESVQIFHATIGPSNPTFVQRVGEFANAAEKAGDPAFAAELRELPRADAGVRRPATQIDPDTLFNFGRTLAQKAQFDEAEDNFRAAISGFRRSNASRSELADVLSDLGEVYRRTARFAEAEQVEAQAYEIATTDTVFPLTRARVLSQYALLKTKTGNLGEALRLNQQAIEIYQEHSPKSTAYGFAVFNLAAVNEALADFPTAQRHYLAAADVLSQSDGVNSLPFSFVATNLGNLHREMGDLDASENLLSRAAETRRHHLGDKHPLLAATLINLGLTYCAMGRSQEAAAALDEAIEIEESRSRPGLDLGYAYQARALVHSSAQEWQSAANTMEKAIAFQEAVLGPQSRVLATMLGNLAFARVASGDPQAGIALMERVVSIENHVLEVATTVLSDQDRAGFLAQLSISLAQVMAIVVRYFPASPREIGIAFCHLLSRKAISAEVMAMERDAIIVSQNVLSADIASLIETDDYQEAKDVELPAPRQRQETHTALQVQLANRLAKLDVKSISLALPPNSVLVEFVKLRAIDFEHLALPEEEYYAFVMKSGVPDSLRFVKIGSALDIDERIRRVRSLIVRSARSWFAKYRRPTFCKEGHALAQILLDPLRKFMGNGQRLFVSPDGELNTLPFEVLPFDKKRLMMDLGDVTYLASGRDILRFAEPRPAPSSPVVVADPNFDLAEPGKASKPDPAAARFGRLPGTRAEGTSVADLLSVKPWLGDEVLKNSILSISSPKILHFATHGFFDKDAVRATPASGEHFDLRKLVAHLTASAAAGNPLLRSGLALASANCRFAGSVPPAAAGDGLLTAQDVTGMNLMGTQLVVLSACVTGLGEIHPSEGTLGLRRSFIVAGAKGLIVSLWSVPDRATATLMEDLYRSLHQGFSPVAALRTARAKARERTSNPYFWGAFVFYGDDTWGSRGG